METFNWYWFLAKVSDVQGVQVVLVLGYMQELTAPKRAHAVTAVTAWNQDPHCAPLVQSLFWLHGNWSGRLLQRGYCIQPAAAQTPSKLTFSTGDLQLNFAYTQQESKLLPHLMPIQVSDIHFKARKCLNQWDCHICIQVIASSFKDWVPVEIKDIGTFLFPHREDRSSSFLPSICEFGECTNQRGSDEWMKFSFIFLCEVNK